MKVLLNVESLIPPLTGIGYYTQNLLAGLREHDDCQVLCFAQSRIIDPGNESEAVDLVQQQREFEKMRRIVRGIPGAYQLRSYVRNFMFRRATQNRFGAAIYHEPNYILKPFDGVAVATIHDLSYIHYSQYHPRERVRYMERELPRTLEKAAHFITDCQFVKDELISILGVVAERITAIPLGVGSQYHPRSEESIQGTMQKYHLQFGHYLFAVATLEPRKNLAGLMTAYMRLPLKERRRFPLVLVGGRGWQCHELEERIAKLEAAGELRYLGYVAAEDLPAIYSGAAGFAFPSHYEGFGLPPLEAMASGVPVLTSSNSAMSEVVGTAGILIDPKDDDAIYQGLVQLLSDDQWRRQAIMDGLSRASQFSWPHCVEQTMAVYRQVKE